MPSPQHSCLVVIIFCCALVSVSCAAEHSTNPVVTEAWQLLKEQVAKLPRTIVVTEKLDYLYVECRSALFGFVDDLEFHLRAARGTPCCTNLPIAS